MDPDDSSTSRGVWNCLFFQSAKSVDAGLLLHMKRERAREWEMAVTVSEEKITNPNPTFTQTESL